MMLLANGGMLPQYLPPVEGEQKISPRKRGVKQGALIFLLGVVLVPAPGVDCEVISLSYLSYSCCYGNVLSL